METNALNRVSKVFKYLLLSLSILCIFLASFVIISRINYPFELEWLEGSFVEHVRRVLLNQKLYVSPSIGFVPFGYTPLYFYISACVAKIFGLGFISLRVVSLISSIGCFLLIFLIVSRETGSKFPAIVSCGLFAASFRATGAIFDIARMDMLFLFLFLAALYLIKFTDSSKFYILAGVLVSLAFLTKQTALAMSWPLMLYCFLINRRRSILFIGTIAAIIGLSTLLLNYIHDGWYNYYVFDVPKQRWRDTIIKKRFLTFWYRDIFLVGIAFATSVFYLVSPLNLNKKSRLFYLLVATGMIGASWLARLEHGAYENSLIPAYTAICILFGLGINELMKFVQVKFKNNRKLIEICVYSICLLQLGILKYNPILQIPNQGDLEAGKQLLNTISQIQGDVYMPFHSYLPTLVSKNSYAHGLAIGNILATKDGPVKTKMINEIRQAMREKKFSALILDTDSAWNMREYAVLREEINKSYMKNQSVFKSEDIFLPVTTKHSRPEYIYIPK